jgi:RNA polymerase sigma-70 factor, ECF subfamily
MPPPQSNCQLLAAHAGSKEALGELLESHRGYLLLIAQEHLGTKLSPKGDASDLVQETFLEAYRDFGRFQGNSDAELRPWLRRLLLNNLANFSRRFRNGGKRDLDREVPLQTGGPAQAVAADDDTPSECFATKERDQQVTHALERLPEDYRLVLQLRYREKRPFEEIATLMQRSPNAVRKLWARAVKAMQQELEGNAHPV